MRALLFAVALASCSKDAPPDHQQQPPAPISPIAPTSPAVPAPPLTPPMMGDVADQVITPPDAGGAPPPSRKPDEPRESRESRESREQKPRVEDGLPPSLYEMPPPEPPPMPLPPTPRKTEPRAEPVTPPAPPLPPAPPAEDRTSVIQDTKPPPEPAAPSPRALPRGSQKLVAMANSAMCVTTGAAKIGARMEKAAMRAVVKGSEGDAAAMTFTFQGDTPTMKKLASGQERRQLGLKLRAENGCNLIYVMWRLDPRPKLDVSVKRNPGARDHKACGAGGYTKIKPAKSSPLPDLVVGDKYTLKAEISGDELTVWLNEQVAWRGTLPESARDLRGPAGIRSDNLAYDLESFSAPAATAATGNAKCVDEDGD